MALYNISSPSGGEKRMARFITDELRRMGIPYRKTQCGSYVVVQVKTACLIKLHDGGCRKAF